MFGLAGPFNIHVKNRTNLTSESYSLLISLLVANNLLEATQVHISYPTIDQVTESEVENIEQPAQLRLYCIMLVLHILFHTVFGQAIPFLQKVKHFVEAGELDRRP